MVGLGIRPDGYRGTQWIACHSRFGCFPGPVDVEGDNALGLVGYTLVLVCVDHTGIVLDGCPPARCRTVPVDTLFHLRCENLALNRQPGDTLSLPSSHALHIDQCADPAEDENQAEQPHEQNRIVDAQQESAAEQNDTKKPPQLPQTAQNLRARALRGMGWLMSASF